jgi:glyoxylase-like metal-dependent hydrolase (beta-lactamase superfamily II)
MNIVNVGYHSTNYYAIDIAGGKLLVDCGWPRTLPQFLAELKRKDIAPSDIKYLLATHFHPDHAGLVQEFKNLGAKLILLESQTNALGFPAMSIASKTPSHVAVSPDDNIILKFIESRQFLASLGLAGEIIATPGHSDDSITLILDEGFAFTGDLPPRFIVSDDEVITRESWDRIYRHKITRIFPAHGS